MSFDNVLKFMVEADPQAFVDWLLPGSGDDSWELLNTELKLEPIRADTLFFLRGQGRILHLEFQTVAKSEPPIPFRMLDYWVRLYRQIIENRVERSNVAACIQLLAGIGFGKSLISLYLREELMQESVVYQSIVAESMQKGEQQGLERGLQLGLQQGLQQGEQRGEATLVLRLLTRRFGVLSTSMTEQIRRLGTIQLESLGEALLDFSALTNVEEWLAENSGQ